MYIQWIFYVKKYGYGCQIFNVKTNDGYINTLHRILKRSSKRSNGETQNPTTIVVFLQQEILGTSAYYVIWFQEETFRCDSILNHIRKTLYFYCSHIHWKK